MSVLVNQDFDFNSAGKVTNLPAPTASGDAATKGYVDSTVEGLAWKDSVRVASTATINLAAPGTTIDGVTMAANDRFLAKDQTTGSQNGIYIYNGSAVAATRAPDMDTAAEVEQAVTTVEEGTSAGATFRQTAVNVTLNTTTLTWNNFGTAAPSASETTQGIIEIATQTEVNAGVDATRAVTPAYLAAYSGRKLKYAADFGDGSATSYTITHNLGTEDVLVEIHEKGGSKRKVIAEIQVTSANAVTIVTKTAPASNAYRAVVMG